MNIVWGKPIKDPWSGTVAEEAVTLETVNEHGYCVFVGGKIKASLHAPSNIFWTANPGLWDACYKSFSSLRERTI